jgi:hypothetical protein
VLRDYVDVALFRDVVERHGVSNVPALRYLVRALLRSPGAKFSVNRSYNDLRSQAVRVAKDTLHEYLGYLEDAYLVFPVRIASESVRAQEVNPRKCYLADHALARASSYRASADLGHLLENIVYLALRRRGREVRYLVTRSGCEVDFVAEAAGGGAPELVQVCADLSEPGVRERELRALAEALAERGLERATIVTLADEGSVAIDRREVRIRPAWRWLLESLV